MCGRFAVGVDADQIAADLGPLNQRVEWRPLYSIAPTDDVPIVHEQSREGERVLEVARWDWPQPEGRPRRGPLINARLEKLDSRFWVGAFSRSRCIVPMTGWYEWTGQAGSKQPHYLHGRGLLAAAGLTWRVDGERVCVVVTRQARDAAGRVHDRMPAFLSEDLRASWLDPAPLTVEGDAAGSKAARSELLDALALSSEEIAASVRSHLVDRRVSSVQRIDPGDASLVEAV